MKPSGQSFSPDDKWKLTKVLAENTRNGFIFSNTLWLSLGYKNARHAAGALKGKATAKALSAMGWEPFRVYDPRVKRAARAWRRKRVDA